MKERFLILLVLVALPLFGRMPVWKMPAYSLTAREMDVRQALDSFGIAQGVPIICSEGVNPPPFSGVFKDVPAAEFLDQIATINNLSWYYDGASLFFYGAGEILSSLIDLKYLKAEEVLKYLKELGVEDERFPLKTASNGELLLVSGPPRYVALVVEMIEKADKLREQRTFNEIEMRVFPLKHTWADDVTFNVAGAEGALKVKGIASLLTDLMTQMSGGNVKDVANGKSVELQNELSAEEMVTLQQTSKIQPVIKADNRLNAVVIRDAAIRMPMYEKIIRQLDKQQVLVEVEVTMVDLTRDDALDWQLSLKVGGSRKRFTGAAGQLPENLVSVDNIAGGLAGAMSYLGANFNLSASLTALKEKHKARSVFRTVVLTLNNMTAEVSDTKTFYAKVTGTEAVSFEKVTAGTTLNLRPRVVANTIPGNAPLVWMTMELQDGGFDSVTTVDEMPMSSNSSLTTQAAVFGGESLLLAGYMRDVVESVEWGIPYLRSLPFIGWLFGGLSDKKETVQRMFILTPRVLDLDTEFLAREQATRMRDLSSVEDLEETLEEQDDQREIRDEQREIRKKRRQERLSRDLKIIRAEAKLENERIKTENKAEDERLNAEWEAAEARLKEELAAEAERIKAERAAEEERIKAERAAEKATNESSSN